MLDSFEDVPVCNSGVFMLHYGELSWKEKFHEQDLPKIGVTYFALIEG